MSLQNTKQNSPSWDIYFPHCQHNAPVFLLQMSIKCAVIGYNLQIPSSCYFLYCNTWYKIKKNSLIKYFLSASKPNVFFYFFICTEFTISKKRITGYVLLPIIILYIQHVCNQGKTETKIKDWKKESLITVITTFIPPLF